MLTCWSLPPLGAVTRPQAKIVPGEEKQVTSQLWGELMLLDGFVRGLAGEGVSGLILWRRWWRRLSGRVLRSDEDGVRYHDGSRTGV